MKLLITHDGSRDSAAVFEPAARLARALAADVVLLHVLTESDARAERSLRRRLERAGATLRRKYEVVLRPLSGKRERVDQVIAAVAAEYAVDLIVMSTHGESALHHVIAGSVALNVVQRSDVPVALVRPGRRAVTRRRGPARLLVTHDGSTAASAALAPSAKIARDSGAEVALVRIHHPVRLDVALEPDAAVREARFAAIEEQMVQDMRDLAKTVPLKAKIMIRRLAGGRWNVADEVLAAADDFDADLICMGARGSSGLRHLLMGSIAFEVLARSDRPVMLVRPNRRRAPADNAASAKAVRAR